MNLILGLRKGTEDSRGTPDQGCPERRRGRVLSGRPSMNEQKVKNPLYSGGVSSRLGKRVRTIQGDDQRELQGTKREVRRL